MCVCVGVCAKLNVGCKGLFPGKGAENMPLVCVGVEKMLGSVRGAPPSPENAEPKLRLLPKVSWLSSVMSVSSSTLFCSVACVVDVFVGALNIEGC